MTRLFQKLPFHYGWTIVFTGTLILFACLGLARFAYGMMTLSLIQEPLPVSAGGAYHSFQLETAPIRRLRWIYPHLSCSYEQN